jgi:hypothetical protein
MLPLIEIIADALQNMHVQIQQLAKIHDPKIQDMGERFEDAESGAA